MSHVDNQSEYTHTITALVRPATSPIIADVVKHPNSEADARLIAAAPGLLEACRDLLYACRCLDTMDPGCLSMFDEETKRATDAIAKAKGSHD